MSVLKAMFGRWRKPPIASVADLATFLDRQSAQITQRSIIGYCHVKTNLPFTELNRERQFADAFEIARWEGYAAVLSDLVVISESVLRPAAGGRLEDLAARLVLLYAEVLGRHPVPSHRPDGWEDTITALRRRLARSQLGPPRPIAQVAEISAERLYATLPIHERLRAPDKPAIVANVQFLLVGLAHEFEKGFAQEELVEALIGSSGGTSQTTPR
jgi:hypothetical protein